MARTNQRGRKNNNPEGHNQYDSWMSTAKDKPFTTAATAAAAVGAGVFLWSRRNQISEQISNLSEQIMDWSESMRSDSRSGDESFAMAGADTGSFENASGSSGSSSRGSSRKGGNSRSGRGMSETGAGNASLGAHSGSTGTGAAS